MFCTKCGAQIADGARFCTQCGTPVSESLQQTVTPQAPNPSAPAPTPVDAAPVTPDAVAAPETPPAQQVPTPETPAEPAAPVPEAPDASETPAEAPAPETFPTEQAPTYDTSYVPETAGGDASQPPVGFDPAAPAYGEYPVPEAPKKKKHIGLFLALGAVAAACIIALVVGFVTDWFGLNGPMAQLGRAMQGMQEVENCTAEIQMTVSGITVDVNMAMDIQPKTHEAVLLADMNFFGQNINYAIHNNTLIMDYDGEYYSQDISETMDELWETIDESQKSTSLEDLDWEELLKSAGVYDTLEEHVDFDAFDACLKTYYSHLNSSSWMKTHAGYAKTKGEETVYTFDIPLADFLTATLEDFQEAFKTPSEYDEAMEDIEDMRSELEAVNLVLEFGVSDGTLSSVTIEFSGLETDSGDMDMRVTISDIGTTEIDMDALAEMEQQAN